eukprot:m.48087 g.48087  ORF g.48087 m.48087 type:complete len:485 (-) comp13266_c0_seq1:7-1461(-)
MDAAVTTFNSLSLDLSPTDWQEASDQLLAALPSTETIQDGCRTTMLAHDAACRDFLAWADGHMNIGVVAADLPIDGNGKVYDIKVKPARGYRIDDEVYLNDAEVRARVARGNTLLEHPVDGIPRFSLVLQGLLKFTGAALGDDDDVVDMATSRQRGAQDDSAVVKASKAWQDFFVKDPALATHAVIMQKANGEAAHFSAQRLDDRWVIFAGSKNVHLAITCQADLALYQGQRYRMALIVATAVWTMLTRMSTEQREQLLRFLAHTGWTAVFELLQPEYQHVEVLHVKEPTLLFITWVKPSTEVDRQTACALRPDAGLQLATALGMGSVTHEVVPIKDAPAKVAEVSGWDGKEGAVVYYMSEQGEVLGLVKKKSTWYVIVRACREKTKAAINALSKERRDTVLNADQWQQQVNRIQRRTKERMKGRLTEIEAWLQLTAPELADWQSTTEQFLTRLFELLAEQESFSSVQARVQAGFPTLWVELTE